MNDLYNLGIIEGFLSQHAELPVNVRDAFNCLKETAKKSVEPVQPVKKKGSARGWGEKSNQTKAKAV